MPGDLVERMVKVCRWAGEGKLVDGVRRLMGGGRKRGLANREKQATTLILRSGS
jgi:hypothetical protein